MSNTEKVSITIKKLSDVESLGQVPKVTQKKDSEKRKIKFREEFVLKCKRAYRLALVNYYMKQESKLLDKEAIYNETDNSNLFDEVYREKLENAKEKKLENIKMFDEHQKKLDEIQQLKDMRDGNYKGIETTKEEVTTPEVTPTPIAPNTEGESVSKINNISSRLGVTNTVEHDEIENNGVEVSQELDTANTVEVVEDNTTVEDTDLEIVPIESSADANQRLEEVSVVEEPVVVVEPEVSTEPISLDPVVQNSLAQDVQDISKSVEADNNDVNELISKLTALGSGFENAWKTVISQAEQEVKEYNKKVEKTSMEAVASKQRELDESKRVNVELTRDLSSKNVQIEQLTTSNQEKDAQIGQLTTSNQEKDAQIGQLTTSNQEKDVQIGQLTTSNQQKDAQIEQLTISNQRKEQTIAELQREMQIMSQQFQKMSAMFNDFQNSMNVGTAQTNDVANVAEEDGPVLVKAN